MEKSFKVAAIVTEYHAGSHADVLISRWLQPRVTDPLWGWNGPRTKLMSLHLEQETERDVGRKAVTEHGVPMYDTVRGALTGGGDTLAADAVLLIGEHGDYPENEIGQQLYPRKELFDQIVEVFRESGQSVPVFCDKHFSWNYDWAVEMVQTAKEMGFLFFGGSSIPHCMRNPSNPKLDGRKIEEVVDVYYGPWERYGFHSLDYVQAMIERRAGGETGIRSITAYKGDDLWKARDAGVFSWPMAEAALGVAAEVKPGNMMDHFEAKQPPAAHVVEYLDGLKVTHLNLTGHMKEFATAIKLADESQPLLVMPRIGYKATHHAHFATLARLIEDAFLTGQAPFPVERTLLTTGATAGFMKSLAQPGKPLETPELAIKYQPGHCASVWHGY